MQAGNQTKRVRLTLPIYLDSKGNHTCVKHWLNAVCPFYKNRQNDAEHSCGLAPDVKLQRRSHEVYGKGMGSLIPLEGCKLKPE